MASKLICTICSKEKRMDIRPLPAQIRYKSDRIKKVNAIAKDKGFPFVILSGKYGILSPDEKIPYYNHLLKPKEAGLLTKRVTQQIKVYDIDEVIFYAKPNDLNWQPYYSVLENVTNLLGIKLTIELI